MRLHNIRNGRSVTPAIGATARLFGSRRPPMRTTRIYFFGGVRIIPVRNIASSKSTSGDEWLTQSEEHRASESPLRDRQRVEQHHADTARHREPRPVVAEQVNEAVRECDAGATIAGAPGAIAREHSRAADIGAWRVDDDRRQFERVAKTEVESLARDRMQRLRSVADDGDTVGRRVARHFQCQRKRAPRADAHETANTVAEVLCELAHEFSVS